MKYKASKMKKISKAKNWSIKGRMKLINAKHDWSKKQRRENQITDSRTERGKITHDSENIQRILRKQI